MHNSEDQEARIQFLLQLRSKGEKSETALLSAYKQKFGLSQKQYQDDSKKVKALIAEYYKADVQSLCEELSMHLWDLYAKSMKLQDYRECRAILKQISDLAISKTDVSQETEGAW